MTLLEAFHEQIRLAGREDEPRPGLVIDRDGPVRRTWMHDPAGFAMVECPAGLGEDPGHWIGRQVDLFRGRGQELEWKTYDDDEPADSPPEFRPPVGRALLHPPAPPGCGAPEGLVAGQKVREHRFVGVLEVMPVGPHYCFDAVGAH